MYHAWKIKGFLLRVYYFYGYGLTEELEIINSLISKVNTCSLRDMLNHGTFC